MKAVSYFESIFQKRVSGIKPGLARMQKAYESLGRPAADIPVVLIGGTNGKGSTAGFLWSLLHRAGIAVGLYSSPHLVNFIERYQMSHAQTTDDELVDLLHDIKARLPSELYDELSFFEIATLLAFVLFARYRCQFLVLEVGLGGRWDATNVVSPLASVVVSISRDHEVYLGSDLSQITREKLAIGRAGRPLFWGCSGEILNDAPAVATFSETAKELELNLLVKGLDFKRMDHELAVRIPGVRPIQLNMPVCLRHLASFLHENFLLAVAVYHWLAEQGLKSSAIQLPATERLCEKISQEGLRRSLSMVARCQKILVKHQGQTYPLLFDVCHNPDGVRVLGESLSTMVKRPPAFISILADKKVDEMLDQLRTICGPIILFEINDARSMKKLQLAERHRDLPYFESFSKAWQHALEIWQNHESPWLVCGSVLAVGQILHEFNIQPFEAANENFM